MLVVTEEKAAEALALVAAHGVDADLLAASVVVLTLVHICGERRGGRGHTWAGREARSAGRPWRLSAPPLQSAATEEPRGDSPQQYCMELPHRGGRLQ